jgi:membrane protein involved in colicin uptake
VDMGPAQAMRGGQAATQVNAHAILLPQQGLTQDYDRFNSMFSEMQKSINAVSRVTAATATSMKSLLDSLSVAAKAEEDGAKKEEDERKKKDAEEVEKASKENAITTAHRKARIAVRKAEDEDDDKEYSETAEKAHAAVKALSDAVTKAEDEAESDDDEKMTEKARTDLKALKSRIKTREEAVAKAKAAPEVAAVVITKTDAAVTAPQNTIAAELTAFATSKGLTVQDMMSVMAGNGGSVLSAPPSFAKAINSGSLSDIERRLEDAIDSGTLGSSDIVKAETIKSRLIASRNGKYDSDTVIQQIAMADPNIRDIFMPSVSLAA